MQINDWLLVVKEFQGKMAGLGQQLIPIIDDAYQHNQSFKKAFEQLIKQCRKNINPNLAEAAVKDMLIQQVLTERIFTNLFNNSDFLRHNPIAQEIDTVIQALSSQTFSKTEFFAKNQLDKFYTVLEQAVLSIEDYEDKQTFLNTVYEQFFQGFAVKLADTYGIVYTPQPIVEFMVKSVEEILHREFGKSLANSGVHVIDPFVGTGNFIIRILHEIHRLNAEQLSFKYQNELYCHEIMLLPYYIACTNIEHAFYELTGEYCPFPGIRLVDTFELIENEQIETTIPAEKQTSILVIIGNPPYNAKQVNENDNNKNRKYPKLEQLIAKTYAKDSKATNKNALSDTYVKAFQWATWQLRNVKAGIVAFVTNNGFLNNIAFDGMRHHLRKEFDTLFIVDLGGNVRKHQMGKHNVFGIRVGVSIVFLVKGGKTETEIDENQ